MEPVAIASDRACEIEELCKRHKLMIMFDGHVWAVNALKSDAPLLCGRASSLDVLLAQIKGAKWAS